MDSILKPERLSNPEETDPVENAKTVVPRVSANIPLMPCNTFTVLCFCRFRQKTMIFVEFQFFYLRNMGSMGSFSGCFSILFRIS